MDRTALRAAFTGATQTFFDAQEASDAAAAKAGNTRGARQAAERMYNQAATAGKKEALAGPLLDLQVQDGTDTADAQTAWSASQTAYRDLYGAMTAMNTNPGAVELV